MTNAVCEPVHPSHPSSNETPNALSSRTWQERAFLLAIVVGGAVAMSSNRTDPDLWGHVTYGIDALRDGLATTATYSYTAEGYRWINHENLAEIAMALVAISGGAVGLLVLKFALSLVVLGSITYWGIRQGRSLLPMCIVLVIVAINLAHCWGMRPQIFSLAFMALTLLLLSLAFEGWAGSWHLHWPRQPGGTAVTSASGARFATSHDEWFNTCRLCWLWLAPVLFFIWTNTHGGFVAGVAVFTAFLGLRSIEAICVRGWAARDVVLRLALIIGAVWLVTLINPYSWRLHHWLYVSLSVPRPEIGEWTSQNLGAVSFWSFVVLAGVLVLSLAFSRRSLDATHLTVFGLVLWQAVSHERHTGFLALLVGFWLPPHVESLLQRWNVVDVDTGGSPDASLNGSQQPTNATRPYPRILAIGLLMAFILLGVRLYQRLSYMAVAKDEWPVAAVQFIADRQFNGKLLVTFNWAQYAIAALGPSSPEARDGLLVQFDGRYDTCYPFEVVDMHFDFILGDRGLGGRYRSANSGPIDGSLALKYLQPDILLLSRRQPHSQKVVREQHDEWVLLYQDAIAQVWGRRSTFDEPESPQYVSLAQRKISDEPQIGSVGWPALPQRGNASRLAGAMGLTKSIKTQL